MNDDFDPVVCLLTKRGLVKLGYVVPTHYAENLLPVLIQVEAVTDIVVGQIAGKIKGLYSSREARQS